MAAKKRKATGPKASNFNEVGEFLNAFIQQHPEINSISMLERRAGMSKDTVRRLMKGPIYGNRQRKAGQLAHLASILGMTVQELDHVYRLAGLLGEHQKSIDLGTQQQRLRWLVLAQGGNPSLCTHPLGILAAWRQGGGPGITMEQLRTGMTFGFMHRLRQHDIPSAGFKSCLFSSLYPEYQGSRLVNEDEDDERYEAFCNYVNTVTAGYSELLQLVNFIAPLRSMIIDEELPPYMIEEYQEWKNGAADISIMTLVCTYLDRMTDILENTRHIRKRA